MYSESLRDAIHNDEKKQAFVDLCSLDWAEKEYHHNGNTFTQWELTCAFDQVANDEHWKNPIYAIIPDADIAITSYAIMHIAGCAAEITSLGDNTSRIEAVGYFEAVGA